MRSTLSGSCPGSSHSSSSSNSTFHNNITTTPSSQQQRLTYGTSSVGSVQQPSTSPIVSPTTTRKHFTTNNTNNNNNNNYHHHNQYAHNNLSMTKPTSRNINNTTGSRVVMLYSPPKSPTSLNISTTSSCSSTGNTTNVIYTYSSSRYLQIGLSLIIISVLIIDGIAILSHRNLFETIRSSNDATATGSRNLSSLQQQHQQQSSSSSSFVRVASSTTTTTTIKQLPLEPKIVWLMSFPNSGTSYTSQLVRDITYTVVASNYADETPLGQEGFVEPVYEDQIHGPFWIQPPVPSELSPLGGMTNGGDIMTPDYIEPTQYILTKTHCGMRCTLCPPEKYTESSYSFRRRCLTTKWVEEQEDGTYQRVFGEYKADRVAKAVHLIRNPLDNIVSRFHLDHDIVGRTANQYDKSRNGFRSYCSSIDTLYSVNEDRVHFLDEEILLILRKVPCHEEFIRYVEWHNLAFSTADDLRLPTYVLHYEWYNSAHRYDTTVRELLNFLGFTEPTTGVPVPFRPSVSYDYFTNDEKIALKQAYQMMSSSQTWSHISQYFNDLNENSDKSEEDDDDTTTTTNNNLIVAAN